MRSKIVRVKIGISIRPMVTLLPLSGLLLTSCHSAMNQTTHNVIKNTTVNETPRAYSSRIVPGQSVGPVQLGDTRERAQQVLGTVFSSKYYEEYTYQPSKPCWPQMCCE